MAVVAVRMESLLGPLVNGEQFRHGYSNVGAHSRQPVVAVRTLSLSLSSAWLKLASCLLRIA